MNQTFGEISETSELALGDFLILLLKCFVFIAIILSAVLGNALVIASVFKTKKLRTSTNYFIVSLACADIFVALFAMTFNAVRTISETWEYGKFLCDFWNSADVLFCTSSIIHLSSISLERYYAIVYPFNHRWKMTSTAKTVGIIIGTFVACWLPFFIVYIITNMCTSCECPEIILQIVIWTGYANSSLNPIIYCFFNKDFRESFKNIITGICGANKEGTFLDEALICSTEYKFYCS
ncbi:octopamine receptor beta-2R-like [Parasteatoda tepidariorum]|uniref:octopamine receptor beta-2R-like n=1 Tax=Parasteatoda tepidariorum TaxID=114398 RepID=UPI0039BCF528